MMRREMTSRQRLTNITVFYMPRAIDDQMLNQ